MKINLLSCRKAIVRNDLKSFWFISLIFGFFLFFVQVIPTLTSVTSYGPQDTHYMDFYLIDFPSPLDIFILFIIPILLGVVFFKYIQKTNHNAMIHSMPFRRDELYNSHIVSANIIYMLPIIINLLLVLLLSLMVTTQPPNILGMALYYLIGHFMLFNLLFLMTSGIGMIVGSLVMQFILSYIFILLPKILSVFFNGILDITLKGYPFSTESSTIFDELSPFILIIKLAEDKGVLAQHVGHYIIVVVFTLLAYVIGRLFYTYRHLERNKDYISYDFVRYIFIYGMTFCGTSLGGLYLYYIVSSQTIYFGFLIGGFISHIIALMISYKTVYIFKKLKGFLVYSLVFILFIIVLQLDLTGYVDRSANLSEIEYVKFDHAQYDSQDLTHFEEDPYRYGGEKRYKYESEEAIEIITSIHKIAIEYVKENGEAIEDGVDAMYYTDKYHSEVYAFDRLYMYHFGLEYKTKLGGFKRKFSIPYNLVRDEVEKLSQLEEFIYNNNGILWEDTPEFTNIDILPLYGYDPIRISGQEAMMVYQALKKDLVEHPINTYSNLNSNGKPHISLTYVDSQFGDNDREVYDDIYNTSTSIPYSIYQNYDYTRQVLIKLGLDDMVFLDNHELKDVIISTRYANVETKMGDHVSEDTIKLEDEDLINEMKKLLVNEWGDIGVFVNFSIIDKDGNEQNIGMTLTDLEMLEKQIGRAHV